ncbi:MAG: metal-dependent transcriptional regulator [Candidatus Bathyarchaeia archaeon]|jgi:DtxR family Mn-dependent transcriptional regulator|nr:metal-dependent transcriptional regulator [Candidatus Bathyarchaeota archaeon A05DMB-4]MDH7595216.1 metal-dependent transcriptional regulator [Candidatus Bathyarchaeota archaeon]
MEQNVTSVIEEYLEAIHRLQEKNKAARTNDLVKMLNVAPGTVTNTVERLEREGYITHVPYKGVKLTEKGNTIALQVLRRHRLSERLLTDILHIDWDKVHEAACRLEHGMTEEILNAIEKTLNHPKTCPHGNPIPTQQGTIVEEDSEPLTQLDVHERSAIVKIANENQELLHYLCTMGISPGVSVEIAEKAPFGGPITIKINEVARALSPEVASVIKVKKKKTKRSK